MAFSDIVNEVIALSDAVQAYWSRELPKRHPEYPLVRPGEDSGPPPEEKEKLRRLLTSLPPDELYKLALIRSLVYGNFTRDDLADRFEALKKELGNPEWLVTLLVEKGSLADDLSDGLEELKKKHIDVDHLLESVLS